MDMSRRIGSRIDSGVDDPLLGGGGGSVASVLREARASLLQKPLARQPLARPTTPAEHVGGRRLFNETSSSQYLVRPSSSHGPGPLSQAFRGGGSAGNGIVEKRQFQPSATPPPLVQKQRPVSGRANGRKLQPLNPLNPGHHLYQKHQLQQQQQPRQPQMKQQQQQQQQQQRQYQKQHQQHQQGTEISKQQQRVQSRRPVIPSSSSVHTTDVHAKRPGAGSRIEMNAHQQRIDEPAFPADIASDASMPVRRSLSGSSASSTDEHDDYRFSDDERAFRGNMSSLLASLAPGIDSETKADAIDDIVGQLERARRDIAAQLWFSRNCVDGVASSADAVSVREQILEAMVSLMDSRSAALVLKASLAMILVTTEGHAEAAAIRPLWQTLFTLTKQSINDKLFRRERLLMPLLNILCGMEGGGDGGGGIRMSASLLDKVYIAGALKNLSIDENNQTSLERAGARRALLVLLQSLVHDTSLDGTEEERVQLAVQATSLMRNLLVGKEQAENTGCDVVDVLSALMRRYAAGNGELALNISRIFSRMGGEQGSVACRRALFASETCLVGMVECLRARPQDIDVVVRLCFVLGNGAEDSARVRLFLCRSTGIVVALADLLDIYVQRLKDEIDTSSSSTCADDDTQAGASSVADDASSIADNRIAPVEGDTGRAMCSVTEVLVKQARLVANLAISAETGCIVASNDRIAEALTMLLETSNTRPGGGASVDELVLNVVSAVTNITYHDGGMSGSHAAGGDTCSTGNGNRLFERAERLGPVLLSLLFCGNDEAVVEAARAIGNVTRDPRSRRAMAVRRQALEALVILLEHGNREVVFAVVGCLMNLASDAECSSVLLRSLGCRRQLIEVLSWSVLGDVPVACVVIKVLYNFMLLCPLTDAGTRDGVRESGASGGGGENRQEGNDDDDEEIEDALLTLDILDRVPPPGTKLSGSPNDEEDVETTEDCVELWELGQRLGTKIRLVYAESLRRRIEEDEDEDGTSSSGELEPLSESS